MLSDPDVQLNFLLMKLFSIIPLACLSMFQSTAQSKKEKDTLLLQPIEINAVRANDYLPIAKSLMQKKEIENKNVGYDLPFILNQTPSVQVNADAGNGIGYTGIRIRGTDATRINITLNSIPYNDAESQGTFLVNLPDFASSAQSIQIQRGIGTSTNGAGAFGGSININTNDIEKEKYIQLDNSVGSYQSIKNTLKLNSGLLQNHIILTGRLSNISSNGYIDRATSKLQSYFTSAAYIDARQSFRLNIFSGKEKTHAAWFGINQETLESNRTYNPAGTEKIGEPYNNETDNYTQTHYQFFYNRKINNFLKYNIAFFLTKGKGYFEQYKKDQLLTDYNTHNAVGDNDTMDLVRQLWLDNSFYGSVFSLQYNKKNTSIIFGGNCTNYSGNHFGEIIFTAIPDAVADHFRWYDVQASKKDMSVFNKWTQKINTHWLSFVDLQIRHVNYTIHGFEKNPAIIINKNYTFVSPKIGLTYSKRLWLSYFSFSTASKEPNRDDYETNINETPLPEQLQDFEWGFEQKGKKINWSANVYYMNYKNQLVLTGKVNNVYAYTRTNIPTSYRMGIELQSNFNINKRISLNTNLTLSKNKIKNFTEYIDNYDTYTQEKLNYSLTDISFSPAIIASSSVDFKILKNMNITLMSKYIGKQYLDNTSNKDRMLQDYLVHDLRINVEKEIKKKIHINCFIQGNNLFSRKYVSNGYTFSYIYGGPLVTENYYFPMATFNWMTGVGIKL